MSGRSFIYSRIFTSCCLQIALISKEDNFANREAFWNAWEDYIKQNP